jgi:hypothetical protein
MAAPVLNQHVLITPNNTPYQVRFNNAGDFAIYTYVTAGNHVALVPHTNPPVSALNEAAYMVSARLEEANVGHYNVRQRLIYQPPARRSTPGRRK